MIFSTIERLRGRVQKESSKADLTSYTGHTVTLLLYQVPKVKSQTEGKGEGEKRKGRKTMLRLFVFRFFKTGFLCFSLGYPGTRSGNLAVLGLRYH